MTTGCARWFSIRRVSNLCIACSRWLSCAHLCCARPSLLCAGRYLISAADDKTIRVWDLEVGCELRNC